jgi:tocopherol cyclase
MKKRKQKNSYFKGWYFKNQMGDYCISFIPSLHIDAYGKQSASLQVIMPQGSYQLTFPAKEIKISKRRLSICIGENVFNQKGIRMNLHSERLSITGTLRFSQFTSLPYDIMGPFRSLPFLQCHHKIYSLSHKVNGSLLVNGMRINFHQGMGYVEGDEGSCFPRNYLWSQCSFSDHDEHALMVSIADVALGPYSFPGCIAVVLYNNRQYRFATYLGARIRKYSRREIWLQQGCYDLRLKLIKEDEHCLLAPVKGQMTRTVYESVTARVHYRFRRKGKIIFDFIGTSCFERGK